MPGPIELRLMVLAVALGFTAFGAPLGIVLPFVIVGVTFTEWIDVGAALVLLLVFRFVWEIQRSVKD